MAAGRWKAEGGRRLCGCCGPRPAPVSTHPVDPHASCSPSALRSSHFPCLSDTSRKQIRSGLIPAHSTLMAPCCIWDKARIPPRGLGGLRDLAPHCSLATPSPPAPRSPPLQPPRTSRPSPRLCWRSVSASPLATG